MDTSGYYKVFIGKLVNGDVPAVPSKELDALLHWLAGRENNAARLIQSAFDSCGVSHEVARLRTLQYLDCTLFAQPDDHHRLLGLSPHSNLSRIRSRHKQLLQVFHPDRHVEDRDWFTKRTEQLNRAYACLKAEHAKPRTSDRVPTGQSAPTRAVRQRQRPVSRPGLLKQLAAKRHLVREKLKMHLGSAQRFERRLYVILYSIPAILLLLVALNHLELSELHEAQTYPSTEVVKEAPDSTERGDSPHEAAEVSKGAFGHDNDRADGESRPSLVPESSSERINPRSVDQSGRGSIVMAQIKKNEKASRNDSQARAYLDACDLRRFPTIGNEDREMYVEQKSANRWSYSYNGVEQGPQDHEFAAQELENSGLYAMRIDERRTWVAMTRCK